MRRPGPVGALLLEGFGSRLAFGLLSFALPLYGRRLGMSLAELGLLVSFSMVVSLLLKPVMGGVADRRGLRRSLVLALLLRSVLSLGYLAVAVPWQLFAVRGLHGASDSLRDPAVHALIAENGDKKAMATTFAWYQTAKSTAGSAGKGLAGVLVGLTGGFALTFGVAFALSLLPLLAVLALVPRDPPRSPVPEPPPPPPAAADGPRPAGVAAYAGLGFLVSGTASMLGALFPVLATEYAGLTPAEAGLVYLVTPVLALTGPLWGRLADRVDRSLVLSLRSTLNAGSALVMLLVPTLAGMWVGRGLDDLGKAAFRPAWGSLMAEISGRDRRTRARTMGYLTAGEDAGDIVAPALAGLLWTVGGPALLLLARVGLALVTEVYAVLLDRRVRRATAPATDAPEPALVGGRRPDRPPPPLTGRRTPRGAGR